MSAEVVARGRGCCVDLLGGSDHFAADRGDCLAFADVLKQIVNGGCDPFGNSPAGDRGAGNRVDALAQTETADWFTDELVQKFAGSKSIGVPIGLSEIGRASCRERV